MRDLPPQADLPETKPLGFASTAPPDDRRLQAAPVGIVRLLT
jgi:hypothetical protein